LIDTTLAAGTKSGYTFSYSSSGSPILSAYAVWVNPLVANQTGVRSFCSTGDGVVRFSMSTLSTCAGTETPLQ
jgi:hypothetical protein